MIIYFISFIKCILIIIVEWQSLAIRMCMLYTWYQIVYMLSNKGYTLAFTACKTQVKVLNLIFQWK